MVEVVEVHNPIRGPFTLNFVVCVGDATQGRGRSQALVRSCDLSDLSVRRAHAAGSASVAGVE